MPEPPPPAAAPNVSGIFECPAPMCASPTPERPCSPERRKERRMCRRATRRPTTFRRKGKPGEISPPAIISSIVAGTSSGRSHHTGISPVGAPRSSLSRRMRMLRLMLLPEMSDGRVRGLMCTGAPLLVFHQIGIPCLKDAVDCLAGRSGRLRPQIICQCRQKAAHTQRSDGAANKDSVLLGT
jgi:hypothetical protein